MKQFKRGLIIGRFQGFHIGHAYMIDKALELCDYVTIFIGSAQESGTKRNPFSYNMRANIITLNYREAIENGRLRLLPLRDIGAGDNAIWGTYVMNKYREYEGGAPDVIISGNDKERLRWLTPDIAPNTAELMISRNDVKISATELRAAIVNGDEEFAATFMPAASMAYFEEMRAILIRTNRE